jgi:hypothetical protein
LGWWKSDVGVTVSAGVSQWNDQSGNGNHLVQATGAAQPTRTLGAVNGLPSIDFDGSDDSMGVTFAMAQPTTVFLFASQTTWTIFDVLLDGNPTNGTMQILQNAVSPNLEMRAGAALGPNTNLPLTTFGLITAIFNGASSTLQVNNTAEVNGNAGASGGGGIRLGCRGDGGGNFANMRVLEAIVTGAVATSTERTNVRAYGSARYGI